MNPQPMHAIEKIFASHSKRSIVKAGEIITCSVDIAEVNDLYLQVIHSFHEMGGAYVKHPDRVVFVFDHYAPAPTIQSASNQKAMRDFVRDQNIRYLFDINAGVCHQVMPEEGVVWPGMILVATDSHTVTHGAFGALGTGVGATDLAAILLTGELWFRVPEIIRIQIDGEPEPCVGAKDIVLHIIGSLKQDAAVYKAIEFTGTTMEAMGVSERMTLCNMAVEMGAKTTYMRPNQQVLEFLQRHASGRPSIIHETDAGYSFTETYTFNVNGLEPQVAIPHSIDTVVPVSHVEGTKVDQVFVGTCTNGRLEDIEIAARILKGRSVHRECRFIVIPASRQVLLEAARKGYIETLVEAGATLSTPGCGPCLGAHEGVLAPGEVCVTTSSRNFPGRMGSPKASIYCSSPAVAAATAVTGRITDPRKILS